MQDDISLQTVWEYGNFITRQSPNITELAKALNLSDSQVDDMFIAASKLEA